MALGLRAWAEVRATSELGWGKPSGRMQSRAKDRTSRSRDTLEEESLPGS